MALPIVVRPIASQVKIIFGTKLPTIKPKMIIIIMAVVIKWAYWDAHHIINTIAVNITQSAISPDSTTCRRIIRIFSPSSYKLAANILAHLFQHFTSLKV